MYAAENLLNKLYAHKWLLQAGVSAIVAADTFHCFYVVTKLANERMKEIEVEEQTELVSATSEVFQKISIRCQAKDGDFWPSAVSRAAGATLIADGASLPIAPRVDILEELLRPASLPSVTDDATSAEDDGLVAAIIDTTSEPTSPSQNPSPQQLAGPPVIYITWDFVLRHTLQTLHQTVHMVAATMEERSEDSSLVRAASENRKWLQEAALSSADAAREWCRGAIRWPTMVLRRKSALRYQIEWQGMTFPIHSSLGSRVLTALEHNLSSTI